MNAETIDICEQVDAMVFSGDSLYDQESLDKFKEYLARWQRQLPDIQQIILELSK